MTDGIITQRQPTPGTGHIFIGKNITPGIIIQQENTKKLSMNGLSIAWQCVDSIYLETIFG